MTELIYPELSYQIVGILFDVHTHVGGGHKERYIQKAVETGLTNSHLKYQRELHCPLVYQNVKVGYYFLDFLVENKIVLEIKVGEKFQKEYINQVLSYLKAHKLKLGILVHFTRDKLRFRRILNLY